MEPTDSDFGRLADAIHGLTMSKKGSFINVQYATFSKCFYVVFSLQSLKRQQLHWRVENKRGCTKDGTFSFK